MKFLTIAFIASSFLTFTAKADPLLITGQVVSTATTAYSGVFIAAACANEQHPTLCGYGVSSVGVLSSLSVFQVHKEEIADVQPDAYAFLAGEEMTLALEEVVSNLKADSQEIESLSDEQIVAIMVEISE